MIGMDRPKTQLFMLQSVDGKISTGGVNERDFDADFPKIAEVGEGLKQYYDLEKQACLVSFISGKVLEKVGVNKRSFGAKQSPVSFVVVDSKPHLNARGCEYLAKRYKTIYLITTNKNHPFVRLKQKYPNIKAMLYANKINFIDAFRKLGNKHMVDKMTVQSGSTLNAHLLRLGLIDEISIVVAPCLIGGESTKSLIGGDSIQTEAGLKKIRPLKLVSCKRLRNSYLHLKYEVIND